VRTNIVTWRHPRPPELIGHLRSEGVLAGTVAPGVLRLVTHHDVDAAGVERARKALSTAPQ
jgi:threonine aldolase